VEVEMMALQNQKFNPSNGQRELIRNR